VRYWHKADMPTRSIDVCFWGESGHHADIPRCPLLIQSGRERLVVRGAVRPRLRAVRDQARLLAAIKACHAFMTIAGVRYLSDGAPTCCIATFNSVRRISSTRLTPA